MAFPNIVVDRLVYTVKPYGGDFLAQELKKDVNLKQFLDSINGEVKVLYFNWEVEEFVVLQELTTEDDIFKPGCKLVKLRIEHTAAEKTFDENSFFTESGIKLIKSREHEHKFDGLRKPQLDSLMAMRERLRFTDTREFLIVLPTGVGKTVVMALAPFALNVDKVLILTPTVYLKQQVATAITRLYRKRPKKDLKLKAHPIGRVGNVDAHVVEWHASSLSGMDSDVIVGNVQAFTQKAGELSESAKHLFKEAKFELVIVDEGHHSAAASWILVQRAVWDKNPHAKFLFLTATPVRTDGAKFGITRNDQLFIYKRKDAQISKYIKETKTMSIKLSKEVMDIFAESKIKDLYNNNSYIREIMIPALKKLIDLRATCNNQPLRMLVFARTNDDGKALSEKINSLCKEHNWDLHAENVKGSEKDDYTSTERRFSCSREQFNQQFKSTGRFVDIVVQVKLFGEGYDNPWICMTTFVAPQIQLAPLAQGHGRALRSPPLELGDLNSPQKWHAYLVYPNINNLDVTVQSYLDGVDEEKANIVSMFYRQGKSAITIAHHMFQKKEREENAQKAVEFMATHNPEYHELYRDLREKWPIIPAVELAKKIFNQHIAQASRDASEDQPLHFSIADFGCGEDLLFEKEMTSLSNDHQGVGEVEILAIDVKEYHDNGNHTGGQGLGPEQLVCTQTPIACNYTDLERQEKFKKFTERCGEIDAAVFCLSMILKDSFPNAFRTAVNIVKPNGHIYIVRDHYKFGINMPGYSALICRHALNFWKDQFSVTCGHLLEVKELVMKKNFVFLSIKNVEAHEFKEKLCETLLNSSVTSFEELMVPKKEMEDIIAAYGQPAKNNTPEKMSKYADQDS